MENQHLTLGNNNMSQFKEELDTRDHYVLHLIDKTAYRLSISQGDFVNKCRAEGVRWIQLIGLSFDASQVVKVELVKVPQKRDDLGISRDERAEAVTSFAKITPIPEWLSDEVKKKIGIETLGDTPTRPATRETLNDWIGDKLFDCWRDFDTLFTYDFTLYLIDRMKDKGDKWHRDGSSIEQKPKNIDLEIIKLEHTSDDYSLEIFLSGASEDCGVEKILGNTIRTLRVVVCGEMTAKTKYLIRKGERI